MCNEPNNQRNSVKDMIDVFLIMFLLLIPFVILAILSVIAYGWPILLLYKSFTIENIIISGVYYLFLFAAKKIL